MAELALSNNHLLTHSLLAAILYQRSTDSKHKLWKIVSSERNIHILNAVAAVILLQMKNLKSPLLPFCIIYYIGWDCW